MSSSPLHSLADTMESQWKDFHSLIDSVRLEEQQWKRATTEFHSEKARLEAEVATLREEVEALRQWKAQASTTIQQLQITYQATRSKPHSIDPNDLSSNGEPAVSSSLGGVITERAKENCRRKESLDVSNLDEPSLVAAVTLREEVHTLRCRVKDLEENLAIANARWVAAETRGQHHLQDKSLPSLRNVREHELHDPAKAVIAQCTAELRAALSSSGAVTALPLLPNPTFDLSLLLICLRDHCRLAARILSAHYRQCRGSSVAPN